MDPTIWIMIGLMVAFFGLGFFYVWLRREVLQRHDDDDAGTNTKR